MSRRYFRSDAQWQQQTAIKILKITERILIKPTYTVQIGPFSTNTFFFTGSHLSSGLGIYDSQPNRHCNNTIITETLAETQGDSLLLCS